MWEIYFTINKNAPVEADSEIEGDKVELRLDSKDLTVQIASASSEEEALKKAYIVSNRFLDYLAWRHGADIAINPNSIRTDFIDSTDQRKTNVYITNKMSMSGRIVVVKKDAEGNVIETYDSSRPGTITIKASEAASYYRRGKLSSDPFDRFRNFYLVAENIADRIRIFKSLVTMKEQALLQIALEELFGDDSTPLGNVAKHIPGFNLGSAVISEVSKLLYKGHRCQLNHSKSLEEKKIPFDLKDEEEVNLALPLIDFVARSLLQYEEQYL